MNVNIQETKGINSLIGFVNKYELLVLAWLITSGFNLGSILTGLVMNLVSVITEISLAGKPQAAMTVPWLVRSFFSLTTAALIFAGFLLIFIWRKKENKANTIRWILVAGLSLQLIRNVFGLYAIIHALITYSIYMNILSAINAFISITLLGTLLLILVFNITNKKVGLILAVGAGITLLYSFGGSIYFLVSLSLMFLKCPAELTTFAELSFLEPLRLLAYNAMFVMFGLSLIKQHKKEALFE
jgi:hypothetical protein